MAYVKRNEWKIYHSTRMDGNRISKSIEAEHEVRRFKDSKLRKQIIGRKVEWKLCIIWPICSSNLLQYDILLKDLPHPMFIVLLSPEQMGEQKRIELVTKLVLMPERSSK